MPTTILMLPPQTPQTREWAKRIGAALPELSVVVAEDVEQAARAVGQADAAFGTMPAELLRQAGKLRWLQAPQAAPPAGYYYPELIAHPVAVTNFREIYNDHIAAHIMAFVLAFARGLHVYLPQQLRREWRPGPLDTRRAPSARVHRADRRRRRHRRRDGARRRRLRHARDRHRRPAAQRPARHGRAAPARGARLAAARRPTSWS